MELENEISIVDKVNHCYSCKKLVDISLFTALKKNKTHYSCCDICLKCKGKFFKCEHGNHINNCDECDSKIVVIDKKPVKPVKPVKPKQENSPFELLPEFTEVDREKLAHRELIRVIKLELKQELLDEIRAGQIDREQPTVLPKRRVSKRVLCDVCNCELVRSAMKTHKLTDKHIHNQFMMDQIKKLKEANQKDI